MSALPGRANVFWFDTHGDFNTPETTTTGFLDGMALATVTGRCWTQLARDIPGFVPVPEDHALVIGTRDLDDQEASTLQASAVRRVRVHTLRPDLSEIFNRGHVAPHAALRLRSGQAYLHLDLDVLDPREGRVNQFSTPDGLSLAELQWAVATIAQRTQVQAAAVTAFDPASDPTAQAHSSAVAAVLSLVEAVSEGALIA